MQMYYDESDYYDDVVNDAFVRYSEFTSGGWHQSFYRRFGSTEVSKQDCEC